MKDPLGVSPSKGNQGTTRGKEKFLLTSVGIEKEKGLSWVSHSTSICTSELILCSHICVYSATRHNIHMYPHFFFGHALIYLGVFISVVTLLSKENLQRNNSFLHSYSRGV